MAAVAICRVHRYPPTTPEMAEKTRGIGAHTDFGALTLLLQDNGELFCLFGDIFFAPCPASLFLFSLFPCLLLPRIVFSFALLAFVAY